MFSAGGNGGGLGGFGGGGNWGGRGPGPTEPWDWEEAWERMPHNLRVSPRQRCISISRTYMAVEDGRFVCQDV